MENLTSELSNVTVGLAGTESYPIAVTAGQLAGAVMSTLLAQLVTAATTTTAQQQTTTTPTARDRNGTPYAVTDEPEHFLGPGPAGSSQSNLWFWPRLARLLLLAGLSVVGSIGNVFMISSVMIEDHLKKAGKGD
ncbi:alpha-1A adrenergic receptor-like protein [Anopheles sinensis]|uniref:Alpha-1A adrenergic receptor-like protein n=1 Tax=Anopheles sinensis TaxID=74873 RepID=A0A084WEX5_ANOSI|nr:alpha-1A adrenergic receptor-like protein [Anopheles sinensis]